MTRNVPSMWNGIPARKLLGRHLVRAYDPGLSCSTHALGMVPVKLRAVGPAGEPLDEKAMD